MADQNSAGIGVDVMLPGFGTRAAPVIIDVRRADAFEASDSVIAGCLRRDPGTAGDWSAAPRRARKSWSIASMATR